MLSHVHSFFALWAVEVTGLEGIVLALEGTFVVLFVVALVVVVTATVAVVTTNGLVLVSTMCMTVLVAAILTHVALVCVVAKLVLIELCQSVAEFASGAKLNLLMLLHEQAIRHLLVKNILEVLGNGLEFCR